MSEGRRSQVVLLDERRLDIIIQSRLYAGELLDIVASHFNIKEKEYFGIAFIDDTGQYSWLQLDKRILEHEFPKKSSSQGAVLTFYFRIKYFVESITHLNDSATIEAFYLQAKSLIAKNELEIDSDITFQLAALVVQSTYGDFTDELTFKQQLKRLPVLPTSTLKEYPSISLCENKVIEYYKALAGQTRGDAIVNYLSILESLPTYGQHYYEVKDKSGNPCWLGLSFRGISQYDRNDRRTPRRVFLWKQLENLYFRDRKFTVEVHEARRVVHTLSSFNLYEDAIEEPVEEFDDLSSAICDPTTQVSVSRRALAPASVTVYVWYATTPNIAKCIWSMAIAQHQFFLEHNHKKNRTGVVRSLSLIASELCRSVQSLSSASSISNISRSNSSTSLPTIVIEGELSEETKAATIEMLTALQSRKDALQEALRKKTEELKALCLKEGELTGELPPETPCQPGEPQPQVRRRIGTSFTLSDKVFCKVKNKERETLNNLELDYEIQSKIASAAFKLANDITARKSVRKLRKVSYQQATNKLKDIEQKLCTLKREKDGRKKSVASSVNEGTTSVDGLVNHYGLPASSSENSIADGHLNKLNASSVPPSTSLPQLTDVASSSAPASPAKCRQRHQSLQHVPVITTGVYEDVGVPYTTQTRRNSSSYSATSEYDSVSCNSSIASLGIPYRNRFEANLDIEGTNHYSVPNRRASQAFNDPDDLFLEKNKDNISECCMDDNVSDIQFTNSAVLSSSYDERMFHKAREFRLPENVSLADSSYDKKSVGNTSMMSCASNYPLPSTCNDKEKFTLSYSENSLHCQRANLLHKFEHLHISEPELHVEGDSCENKLSVYNVPLLKSVLRPTSTIIPSVSAGVEYSSMSSQNINQVAGLVQASVLLHDSKRAASSGCLEYISPKAKSKEWVETSLDSPLTVRKKKPKQNDSSPLPEHFQSAQWHENGLPCNSSSDFVQVQPDYCDDSSNSIPKYRQSSSPAKTMCNLVSCDYQNQSPYTGYSQQLSNERIYANTNQSKHDSNFYHHHYENEITGSVSFNMEHKNMYYDDVHSAQHYSPQYLGTDDVDEIRHDHLNDVQNYSPQYSSPGDVNEIRNRHEEMCGIQNYSTLYSNTSDVVDSVQHGRNDVYNVHSYNSAYCMSNSVDNIQHIESDDSLPKKYAIAEPQQPSKHLFRQIQVDTVVLPDELPCGEPDYQNLPTDNQFETISYTDISAYSEEPRSNLELNQEYSTTSQTHQEENIVRNSVLNHSVQNWQQVSVAEPNTIPAVSSNVQFSPKYEVDIVSFGHYQPYWEETKPYELADFYKYSTKHRKQQKSTSSNDSSPSQMNMVKDSSEINHQYYEQVPVENANLHTGEHYYKNNIPPACTQLPLNHRQEIVTNHVPVFDNIEQLESSAKYYSENATSSPICATDPDKSLSFGEVELKISLADTFHDEMVAWYKTSQDSVHNVKKATLV